jgi:tetratricopeptide (TPR) repeat protein
MFARFAFIACLLLPVNAMAIDVNAMWDFAKPDASEQRFRDAMKSAAPDVRRVLTTQVARTYGMRGQFDRAREILAGLQADLERASVEVRVRYFLELGRTYASATHPESARTPESLAQARHLFLKAHELAAQAKLDYLAIDALHMMAFVDAEPARQLVWDARALAYMQASSQADAKGWEASLRNNLGYARHQMGDYDEALRQFQLARAAYARMGRERNVRVADWMIAWTYRAQKRYAEAIALQLDLERRWKEAGEADPYVFEELALLYRATGDAVQAAKYDALAKAPAQ